MKLQSPLGRLLTIAVVFFALLAVGSPDVFAQERSTICTAANPISLTYEYMPPALGGEEQEYTLSVRLFPNGFVGEGADPALITCRHIGVFAIDANDSKNVIQGRLTHQYDSIFNAGFFGGVYNATFRFGLVNACKTFRIYIIAEDGTVSTNSLEYRLTCAPPDQRLDFQRARIEELISLGLLSSSSGNLLIGKIQQAKQEVLEGSMRKAVNHLLTFITHVESFIRSKKVLKEEGQALIDRTTSIINQIK